MRVSEKAYIPQHGKGHQTRSIVFGVLLFLLVAIVASAAIYVALFNGKVHSHQTSPNDIKQVLTTAEPGKASYVLLLGSDTNAPLSETSRSRADAIILARLDGEKNLVTLVSIPRDTRWEHDGTIDRINEAYAIGGAALQAQAVSQLLGVGISHVVEINFVGIANLVDAIGGVDVEVPSAVKNRDAVTGEWVYVDAGLQHLSGPQLLVYARERKSFQGGDTARQGHIRDVIVTVGRAILAKPVYTWPELGLAIADSFGSDMGLLDMAGIALQFADGDVHGYSATGPTLGDVDENADGKWLCYENPAGWKRVMDLVEAGEDPSLADPDAEFRVSDDA